jgi:hypothetical protein
MSSGTFYWIRCSREAAPIPMPVREFLPLEVVQESFRGHFFFFFFSARENATQLLSHTPQSIPLSSLAFLTLRVRVWLPSWCSRVTRLYRGGYRSPPSYPPPSPPYKDPEMRSSSSSSRAGSITHGTDQSFRFFFFFSFLFMSMSGVCVSYSPGLLNQYS